MFTRYFHWLHFIKETIKSSIELNTTFFVVQKDIVLFFDRSVFR